MSEICQAIAGSDQAVCQRRGDAWTEASQIIEDTRDLA
jgi:hypothetical protein